MDWHLLHFLLSIRREVVCLDDSTEEPLIDARCSTIRPFRIFRLFFARFHGLQPFSSQDPTLGIF
jgi:hypothetical protein